VKSQRLASVFVSLIFPAIASANPNTFFLENPSADQEAALKQLIQEGLVTDVEGSSDSYLVNRPNLEAVLAQGDVRARELCELLREVAGDQIVVNVVPLSEASVGTQDRDPF
jgi:hypothetical protein